MSTQTHPSFYDLDLWAVGVKTPELEAHVGTCEQCKTHLNRVTTATPIPASIRERAMDPWAGAKRRWRALLAGGFGIGVATAAVLLVARPHPPVSDGVKGNPSIALYVKHDDSVSLWDGFTPLKPGDRIRLKVATDGYSHIAVGSVENGKSTTWLYNGEADSNDGFMLPASWSVDDAPGAEQLTIVLSRDPLIPAELDADSRAQVRNSSVWTTQLILPKQVSVKP